VQEFLKIKWMRKIPEIFNTQLLTMGVDADTSVVPPPPDLPKPDKLPAPEGLKLFLRVELENRLAMARTVDPSLGDEAVKNMSQDEFIRLIRPKLKEHIANAVREKLGDSFPFDGEPQSDTDFGHHSKHSFWLPLSVRNVDEEKALKKIKGEELAGNFSQFLASLNKLATGGVGGLAPVATDLRATVRHSQLKELHTDLARRVAELLHAEVQAVSSSAYEWLQKHASGGICCRSEKTSSRGKSTDEVFWVASNVTTGPDGPAGLCPAISAAKPPCAASQEAHEKTVLHHRPYTECYNFAELNSSHEVPALKAAKIESSCQS